MEIGIVEVPTAVASDNTRHHWRRRGHDGQAQLHGDGDAICSRLFVAIELMSKICGSLDATIPIVDADTHDW